MNSESQRPDVLHLEDDTDLAHLIRQILRDNGYHVRHASTCQSLRVELDRKIPDLLISDVQLPDGNGLELIRDIRGSRKFDDMPVLVLTGMDPADCPFASYEHGANAFLSKLADSRQLLDAIEFLLAEKRPGYAFQHYENCTGEDHDPAA